MIVALPEAAPTIAPVALSMLTIDGAEDVQTPPETEFDNVAVDPTVREEEPVIDEGAVLTVTVLVTEAVPHEVDSE